MTPPDATAGPDGSVVVPARLASTTFAALVLYLGDRTRANGGAITPEARDLLHALNRAAQGPSSASATPDDGPPTVVHGQGQLLGVAEAARVLGCNPSYVRRLCHRGTIPAQRLQGGWVIEAGALDDYRHGRTDGKPGPAQAA